jgi:hypothetical protein
VAKVHELLEMWQGGQNLRATKEKSRAQHNQMTAQGFISDTEDVVKASWSLIEHDGAAPFRLSERSPLPPALSAKDLHEGRTQILNVRRIWRVHYHAVECDEDCAPQNISDMHDWRNWNGNLDNPNDREEDCAADDESDRDHNDGMEESESPEQQDVTTEPNVLGLVRPSWTSKTHAGTVYVTVNEVETRRIKGG